MHSHYIHNHSIRHTLQILSRYWSQEVHPLYSSHGHCPGIDALSSHPQSLYQTYPTDIVSLLIDHNRYIHSTPHTGIVPVLMHSHYIHNHSIRHTLQILSRYWSQEVHPLYSSHGHCPGIDALSLYTQSLYQTYPTDIVSLLITRSTSTLLLTRALSRYWCTLIISHNHSIRHTLQILSRYWSQDSLAIDPLYSSHGHCPGIDALSSHIYTITLSDIPYRYCLAIDHNRYIHSTPHTGIVPVLMHSHHIHNHSIRHTLQILSRYWSQEVHPLYSSHGHCPGIDALSLYTQSLYQTYPTDIVSLLITIGTSTLLLTRALSRYWCTLITSTITLSDIPYRYCLAIDHKKYIHSTPHTGIVPVLMHSHYIHNHSIRHTLQILSRYWSQ